MKIVQTIYGGPRFRNKSGLGLASHAAGDSERWRNGVGTVGDGVVFVVTAICPVGQQRVSLGLGCRVSFRVRVRGSLITHDYFQ